MDLRHASPPDPAPPRHPIRLALSALSAFCVVLLAVAGAAVVFQNAAAPHAAAYAKPASTPLEHTPTPAPQQLQRLLTPEPILAALASKVVKGPAPRIHVASVLCQLEVWTRDENMMTGQRITSWHAEDGSGFIVTLTLPEIPASSFRPSMVARTSFEAAEHRHRPYGPGQMPYHSQWPTVLATDPQTLLDQLEIIQPGIDTATDLMRALATAHTRYVITRETRAATLMLLATTSGITVRQAEIPTYAQDNPPTQGLVITGRDARGRVTFHMMPDIGYLIAAIEHSHHRRAGSQSASSYTVFLGSEDQIPRGS